MTEVEQVFVVRRADFFDGKWPQGYVPLGTDAAALLAEFGQRGFFVDRPAAERNPEWKQLIPYCVLRRPHEVFCVARKKAQTESRLHDLLSIGIGGHVNPQAVEPSTDGAAFLRAALSQELNEELFLPAHNAHGASPQPQLLGLLNDDATEVGSVHVGLVYALDFPATDKFESTARVREVSKMAGGFRRLAELEPLWQNPSRFESWSRILIEVGIACQSGGPDIKAVSRMRSPTAERSEGVQTNENG